MFGFGLQCVGLLDFWLPLEGYCCLACCLPGFGLRVLFIVGCLFWCCVYFGLVLCAIVCCACWFDMLLTFCCSFVYVFSAFCGVCIAGFWFWLFLLLILFELLSFWFGYFGCWLSGRYCWVLIGLGIGVLLEVVGRLYYFEGFGLIVINMLVF